MNAEQLRRKKAKQAYKHDKRIDEQEREFVQKQANNRIVTGIMENEDILHNDYPVYYGHLYVADLGDGNGIVVSSDIQSSVEQLIRLLKTHSPNIKNLRRCNFAARNLF